MRGMITISKLDCGGWFWDTGFSPDDEVTQGTASSAKDALADCTACLLRNRHLTEAINLLRTEEATGIPGWAEGAELAECGG